MRGVRPWIGAFLWLLIVWLVFSWLGSDDEISGEVRWEKSANLTRYLFEDPLPVEISFDSPISATVGDTLYERTGGDFVPVGEVVSVEPSERQARLVKAVIYPRAAKDIRASSRMTHFTATGTAAWAATTLLPAEKVREITEDVRKTFREKQYYLSSLIIPHLQSFMTTALEIIREELPIVVANHRDEIQQVLLLHNAAIVEDQLIPLVNDQIWPIVRRRATPLVRTIGRELWGELPKWGLSWRWAYEKIPGISNDKVQERFNQFVELQGVPILLSHREDLIRVTREVAVRVSRNMEVNRFLADAVVQISTDPELEDLVRRMLNELTVDNERIRKALEDAWTDDAFQNHLAKAVQTFDALMRRSGNAILLNKEGDGINPDLARVLRTNILGKDTSWFLVTIDRGEKVDGGRSLPALEPGHRFRGDSYEPPW